MSLHDNRVEGATFGSRTDVGCVRAQNEDSLYVAAPLFVVCDGMGGHAAGEIASEIAVDVIAQRAPRHCDAAGLGQAVEEANLAVIRAAREGVGRVGMGTTCTAALLENERLVVAQVGDSRAYLLHQGRIQQITRDHSLVADLVEMGEISPDQARNHPQRSVITRALGSDPRMQPDLFEVNVEAGDRLLLCSDGLTSMVEDFEIEQILCRVANPQEAASMLVDAALDAGGYDNVTVVVADVTGFAQVRHNKMARKTKITAAVVVALLIAIIAAAFAGFNYWTSNAAYLGEQDGNVAIYQGIPGEILGMTFSELKEVTDVPVDSLQPGVANRITGEGVRVDSLEVAYEVVDSYREDAADNAAVPESEPASAAAASDTEGGNSAQGSGA